MYYTVAQKWTELVQNQKCLQSGRKFAYNFSILGKMATANPDDADFTCKNPECPKGVFKWKTILTHIARARNCKNFYSEEEINIMRENSKNLQNIQKAAKKKGEKTSL